MMFVTLTLSPHRHGYSPRHNYGVSTHGGERVRFICMHSVARIQYVLDHPQ